MTTKTLEIPIPERVLAELLLRHSMPAQSWQLANPNPMLRLTGMSPYRPTRREFLLGAAGLLVLAPYGCGSGESGGSGEDASGGTRTVEHALDETEVPKDPQRLVVMETGTLDAALTLGVTPVAAPQTAGAFPDYLGEATEGIEPLGPPTAEPNLEAIAALEPDMILATSREGEVMGGYDNFSEIAPTVTVAFEDSAKWRRFVADVAKVLGREEALADAKAAYEARAREVAAAIAPVAEGKESSTLWVYPDSLLIYGTNTFNGTVLKDAGVTIAEPPEGVEETFGYYEVSRELLSEAAADIVFLYSTEPGVVEDLTARPLWTNLEAVQADLAFPVDFEHWQRGLQYAAANTILDDLERFLG